MVKQNKKLWARYERIKTIIGTYIALFLTVPILIFCFCGLAHQAELESDLREGIVLVLKIGLKWYAIIMPIITIGYLLEFFWFSSRVEFTDNAILYYRWLFSKRSRAINYDDITECVFSHGLWMHKGEYVHGRKIRAYNKNSIILLTDLYYKVCMAIIENLKDTKIRVVGDNCNLKTIDNHYNIDFSLLSQEQQVKLLKHYCKLMNSDERDGKKILKIK